MPVNSSLSLMALPLTLTVRPAALKSGRLTFPFAGTAERVTNVRQAVTDARADGNIIGMSVNSGSNPATHFGKQMRKERLAHGWGLREFAQLTGLNAGHLSRIENGKRPPTENVATACDAAFPERRGWFTEYYEELRGWSEVPAAFRNWAELEEKAVRLCDWWPSVVTGLLQTQDYARALINVVPGTTPETAAARLTNRMERQRHLLGRDAPPKMTFIIDELALYRCVGTTDVMAAQLSLATRCRGYAPGNPPSSARRRPQRQRQRVHRGRRRGRVRRACGRWVRLHRRANRYVARLEVR